MQLHLNNAALSQITGYISIGCWMVVGFPQLYENHKRRSGDSVALTFIFTWLFGDLFNLVGAILQKLLLTVILIAIYHCAVDVAIILQTFYYRFTRTHHLDEEVAPLQPQQQARYTSQREVYRFRIKEFFEILGELFGVCVAGVVVYYVASIFQNNENSDEDDQMEMRLLPQIFGWISALLYLGARIPQIIRNHKLRSTEGLSLSMFCFSVLGNVTYCLSILIYSTKTKYILVNLPWLVGNGGTLLFDFSILAQFYFYRNSGN
ncbi:PQ-loop-domain-containing protein [Gigaspora margarita]|uniref:PQ-loop-domain-containing protein n=1 Tax=Gigaspora margarita TaxID=4874 RepID=A0A8H3XJD0_GIGMA|nr:PQ-loop-domain-containing protein [Gigaspora margarita]